MSKTTPSKTWKKSSETERTYWLGPLSGVSDRSNAHKEYADLSVPVKKSLAKAHRLAEATFGLGENNKRKRKR